MIKDRYSFNDLVDIMRLLRKGCPWDKEQTHESLKRYLIEETYEVLEAIDNKNVEGIVEELGDVLLQVVFHAQIGTEEKTFNIEDITTAVCKKMILRHPHVFGEVKAETSGEVLQNWEQIKKKEKGQETQTEVLKGVPSNLPALMRSFKVQQKAAQVGFDWDNIEDVFLKIQEEMRELKEVYNSKNMERITDEMGDIIFAVVNLSRFLRVQPELALNGTTNKFIKRFEYIEKRSRELGKNLEEMTLKEMDELWEEAKINNRKV